ncbi:MAG: helix-turn-helix domain-containing protein [Bacillota bacterium]
MAMGEMITPIGTKGQRKERGWTQSDLAQRLRTSWKVVSRFETRRRGISFSMALDYVDVFGRLRVERGGRRYIILRDQDDDRAPSGGPRDSRTEESEMPVDDLSIAETASRVDKEAREFLACACRISRYLIALKRNPATVIDFIRLLAKELSDLLIWARALAERIRSVSPGAFAEAEAIAAEELAAEFGLPTERQLEVRSA